MLCACTNSILPSEYFKSNCVRLHKRSNCKTLLITASIDGCGGHLAPFKGSLDHGENPDQAFASSSSGPGWRCCAIHPRAHRQMRMELPDKDCSIRELVWTCSIKCGLILRQCSWYSWRLYSARRTPRLLGGLLCTFVSNACASVILWCQNHAGNTRETCMVLLRDLDLVSKPNRSQEES